MVGNEKDSNQERRQLQKTSIKLHIKTIIPNKLKMQSWTLSWFQIFLHFFHALVDNSQRTQVRNFGSNANFYCKCSSSFFLHCSFLVFSISSVHVPHIYKQNATVCKHLPKSQVADKYLVQSVWGFIVMSRKLIITSK